MNGKENRSLVNCFTFLNLTFAQDNVYNCLPLLQNSDKTGRWLWVINNAFENHGLLTSSEQYSTLKTDSFTVMFLTTGLTNNG